MADKVIFTLCSRDKNGNSWEPEITAMTRPLLERYAKKIGAQIHVIEDRKFPDMPILCEKFQIHELVKSMDARWYIYIDSDTMIHPDTVDFTALTTPDITISYGTDFVPMRFKPDKYFLRDGRMIGKGNWIFMASDMCAEDAWLPMTDITIDEAVTNITPTQEELNAGRTPISLIDDYIMSRNIARFGLKHVLIPELIYRAVPTDQVRQQQLMGHLVHWYLPPAEVKIQNMRDLLRQWQVTI